MKKRIVITGKRVQGIGYRLFLYEKAQALCIPNFYAENVDTNRVVVCVAGEKEQVSEFLEFVENNYPKNAVVSKIAVGTKTPKRIMPMAAYAELLKTIQLRKFVKALQSWEAKFTDWKTRPNAQQTG